MNVRQFLKSLIVGSVTLPCVLKSSTDEPKFVLQDIPVPPENKTVSFEHNNLLFKFSSTTHILIPREDGSYELNVYGEFCKVIGTARQERDYNKTGKHVRLEGDIIFVKDLESKWKEQIEKLVDIAVKSFKK